MESNLQGVEWQRIIVHAQFAIIKHVLNVSAEGLCMFLFYVSDGEMPTVRRVCKHVISYTVNFIRGRNCNSISWRI